MSQTKELNYHGLLETFGIKTSDSALSPSFDTTHCVGGS